MSVITCITGHALILDLKGDDSLRLINIYAPPFSKARKQFFEQIEGYCDVQRFLVGDFNSVVDPVDWLSGNLDNTSAQLYTFLDAKHLVEMQGSHLSVFSYHHPSISSWKSRLDCIYLSMNPKTS